MNILVIGNGFDLEHELPTKYTDFLFFCYAVKRIIKDNEIEDTIPRDDKQLFDWLKDNKEIDICNAKVDKDSYIAGFRHWKYKIPERDKEVYTTLLNDFVMRSFKEQKLIKEIIYLIFNNFWIEYFLQCDMHDSENWIDFESEISNVVKNINDNMNGLDKCFSLYDKIMNWSNDFLKRFFCEKYGKEVIYKVVRDKLEGDLNKLIRTFEIYLTGYVEKIDCKLISPNIQEILPKETGKFNGMPIYGELYILSFNYTDTYQRLYIDKKYGHNYFERNIDYIHGKADIDNTLKTNNMVLGIDEYLPKKKKDMDIDFIAFKKFYQRIYKETGCKYKEWVDLIRESWEKEPEESKIEIRKCISRGNLEHKNIHRLYIFGHSLDVTDKDVLRDLILNDNVHTTIFHHNKDTMGQQIANLVKVIGQDELIRRTGGSTKTIEFRPQQPVIPVKC